MLWYKNSGVANRRILDMRLSLRVMIVTVLAFILLCATLFVSSPASALTTVPTKMNFQGRLTTASGAYVANGTYNMRLKLYTVATGGSNVWSEDRLVSATQGVTVTNGLYSIQLGSITTLPASLFASGALYLEVELPTPATATSSSPTWTEGPMTPRNQLATSAYAYNAETLDGLDSADLFQLSAANSSTGSVTLTGSTSASKLLVQASSTDVFRVDTTTSTVTLGTSTNGTTFTAASGMQFVGTARPTETVTFAPEFQGATFTGDGTNNNGSLSSDFCSATALMNINTTACNNTGDEHNYYAWTTTQASAQDYDIYIRYRMPANYDTGSMTNMRMWAWGTTTASEIASIALHKASGTACASITNAVTANATWAESTQASPLGSCSIAAGDYVTFKIKVTAGQNNTVRVGEINFTYRSKF